MYRVFMKYCVFSQFTATHPLHVEEQLIFERHSYWLTIFVQPMAAQCWRRLGHKIRHFLGKNTIINEHPVCP